MSHLTETPEDIAVKDRLWDATYREILRFATKYAEAHVVGERRSEAQKDIVSAAKANGYQIGIVVESANLIRRGIDDESIALGYKAKIGL